MASNKLLFILFFVIVAGLIGGIVYMYSNPQKARQAQVQNVGKQQTHQSNQVTQISPQPSEATGQTDISNAQLDTDSQNIDNNLNSLDTELKSVDQGLNDQPTSLQ